MAIIYSYPENNNILPSDILVCTSTALINGKPKNQTKNISIADLTAFMALNGDNLNDVLTNGNTSLLNADIGQLGLFDAIAQNYGSLELNGSSFNFSNASNVATSALNNNSLVFYPNSYTGQLLVPNTITTNRVYTFPDQSGIVALTSDIAGFVPYTGALSDVDLGIYELTASSIIKAGGTNLQYLLADGSVSTGPVLTGFVPYTGATQAVNLGVYNLTAGSIIKTGGTNLQFLMADGSVSTAPSLTGFVPYTGATQAVNLGAFNLTVNDISIGRGSFAGAGADSNTVVGRLALGIANNGTNNTAIGREALAVNQGGFNNTAIGSRTLSSNLNGNGNTAVGQAALVLNLGGSNTAIGSGAMASNTTGSFNCAVGSGALSFSVSANSNTAMGIGAMQLNNTGANNNAFGSSALRTNSSGANNIAIGNSAGELAIGSVNNTSGNNNIFIGNSTVSFLNNSNNQIVIGNTAIGVGDNTVTLGNTSIITTRLRGAVQGGSFVKDGGTASQFLMADGSVTTGSGGYTYNFGGSLTLTGTLTTTNLLTITIPANSLSDYLDLRSLMVQQSGPALAGFQIRVWHNSVNDFNTATRIANFSFGAGGADLFAQMTRKFSIQSGTLFGYSSTPSNATGDGSNPNAALSIAFNPAAINYLFVSVQLNNVTDTATLRNVNITN